MPLTASPKPFFGYSENTNLHLFLWNLGLVSSLGGSGGSFETVDSHLRTGRY